MTQAQPQPPQYHLTPDLVDGPFIVERITNFDEDDYAYLYAEVEGVACCIIYNYPPSVGELMKELAGHLPTWCRFDEDEYLVTWQPEDTGECPE
jgi:hypothetical protein